MSAADPQVAAFLADPAKRPPLDESLYSLDETEAAFYKTQTGIQDDDELKKHIIAIQTKAYEIYGYPCIRRFSFLKLKISRMPVYQEVLKLGKERKGAILLDIGCCFGNDARKAVADGFPVENTIASDLRQGFWDAGHQLFKSTPETCPIKFIPGDAFDPALIEPHAPFYEPPATPAPADLQSLTSLTPLLGHISAIHASAFFHLFNEERQLQLANILAGLLSPLPGSVIFGAHGGLPEKGLRAPRSNETAHRMFCHSPESWRELWDGKVFKKGTVKAVTEIFEVQREDAYLFGPDNKFYMLVWSVTRV